LDLLLHLVTEGGPPLYRQVVTQIRAAVVSGRLAPGTRLPSSRDLAAVHGIARNTVVAAYQQLADEGYLVGRDRSGHYVAADLPDAALQAAQRPAGGAVGMPAIRLSRWAAALSDLPNVTAIEAPADWDDSVWTNLNTREDFERFIGGSSAT
jgi:GntR family transcriptional regulator/MocR family aminotransferase